MSVSHISSRLFRFARPYSDEYWSKRSRALGAEAVMWLNPHYNRLSDRDQWEVIRKHLPQNRRRMLDLGCGIGRMAQRLSECFESYTGFDIEPMVERARALNPALAESFVEGTLRSFRFGTGEYDLVLSLACISSACPTDGLPELLDRISESLAPGGRLLMVEPMHKHRLLARLCRAGAWDVIGLAQECRLSLVEYTGIQCWPLRMLLTRPQLANCEMLTAAGYHTGEFTLSIAPRLLGDYKVLVFER